MKPTNKIRFVHGNHNLQSPRFTIAYHRDEAIILFAFTNVFHKDDYVRSQGRDVSTARLMQAYETDFALDGKSRDLYFGDIRVGFFNETHKVGGMTIEAFKPELTAVLADHITDKLTPMDLKHSYVAQRLASFVFDYNQTNTKAD